MSAMRNKERRIYKGAIMNGSYADKKTGQLRDKMVCDFTLQMESESKESDSHIFNTSLYVRMIGEYLLENEYHGNELNLSVIELFAQAAPLHDLGKMKVPSQILFKKGYLTEDEYEIIKIHPLEGVMLLNSGLKNCENDEYVKIAKLMALYHHEKWDGTGYPFKLKGQEIPLCARIMAAADVLDALLSKRIYKEAYSLDDSIKMIKNLSGSHFEPFIANAVVNSKEKIRNLMDGIYEKNR